MPMKKDDSKRGIGMKAVRAALLAMLMLAALAISATALPDLAVNNVIVPSQLVTNSTAEVQANVSNTVDQDVANFSTRFFLESPGELLLGETSHRIVYPNGPTADQPVVAVDKAGNLNVVWADDRAGNDELFYKMLSSNGSVLITDTQLTTAPSNSVRPDIAVDANGSVHIVWHDRRFGNAQVFYKQINPGLDDKNSNPANLAAITVVNDTHISNNSRNETGGKDEHPVIALDKNGNIHVAWERNGDESIGYAKLSGNGSFLLPDTRVSNKFRSLSRPSVTIATDAIGNVHIAWNDDSITCADEGYYLMLNGSTGSILINTTLLNPDDCEQSKRQVILVDEQDKVHVVFQDRRGMNTEIYYAKLDPYLDDLNGDAASKAAITLIDDMPLTPDDGIKSNHPDTAIVNGLLHIAYFDEATGTDQLHFTVLRTDETAGNGTPATVIRNFPLTANAAVTTSTVFTLPSIAVDANNLAHLTWTDNRDGNYAIYRASYMILQNLLFATSYSNITAGQTKLIPAQLDTSRLVGL